MRSIATLTCVTFKGYYEETASIKLQKFLDEFKERFETFAVIELSISQAREWDQEITLVYSVDTLELELYEAEKELKDLRASIQGRCEWLEFLLTKKRIKKFDIRNLVSSLKFLSLTKQEKTEEILNEQKQRNSKKVI